MKFPVPMMNFNRNADTIIQVHKPAFSLEGNQMNNLNQKSTNHQNLGGSNNVLGAQDEQCFVLLEDLLKPKSNLESFSKSSHGAVQAIHAKKISNNWKDGEGLGADSKRSAVKTVEIRKEKFDGFPFVLTKRDPELHPTESSTWNEKNIFQAFTKLLAALIFVVGVIFLTITPFMLLPIFVFPLRNQSFAVSLFFTSAAVALLFIMTGVYLKEFSNRNFERPV